MINNFKYECLNGTVFYNNNVPYSEIEYIKKLNNEYYRVFLSNDCYVDLSTMEMDILYREYLNRMERIKILRSRFIKQLVHFTKVDNLENIFEYGICSVAMLNTSSISYLPSDQYRLDGKLNGISTSISFPNYKMFYKKRRENTDVDWAVITLNSNVIIDKLDTEFYQTNAASGDYSLNYRPTSNNDLNNLFCMENREPNLPLCYTTNPQAEILVNNCISNNYFFSVETEKYFPKVKSLTRDMNIKYNVSSQLFRPRQDYKRWQNGN